MLSRVIVAVYCKKHRFTQCILCDREFLQWKQALAYVGHSTECAWREFQTGSANFLTVRHQTHMSEGLHHPSLPLRWYFWCCGLMEVKWRLRWGNAVGNAFGAETKLRYLWRRNRGSKLDGGKEYFCFSQLRSFKTDRGAYSALMYVGESNANLKY
jgi:hypothetical protein